MVILPKPWESYSDEHQMLLQKILASVKLNTASVQMLVRSAIDLESLAIFSPFRVMIFGLVIREELRAYEETMAHNFIVIRADDLDGLDEQKKKNLWIALRKMFGI